MQQIFKALQAEGRLDEKVEQLVKVQDENRELKLKLAETESYQFIERVARNNLNLARPEETMVIIPKGEIDQIINANKLNPEVKMPNWQGWLKLFIK